jgi:hypothetical protein
MIACKDCKWYKCYKWKDDGFLRMMECCTHPSCYDQIYHPVDGTYGKQRKRVKRVIEEDERIREAWPDVDIWTKNEKGDCPDFEKK